MITVVNVAGQWKAGEVHFYVGRPSALGNPFHIGTHGDRETVIEKYRPWLWQELHTEGSKATELFNRISDQATHHDVALECWCAPLPCHADVIKELVEQRIGDNLYRGNSTTPS